MMLTTNFWNQFLDLLPKTPMLKGVVLSRIGSDSDLYDVTLISGGILRVSSATVFDDGTPVFIKNGVIVGKAPDLPSSILEI